MKIDYAELELKVTEHNRREAPDQNGYLAVMLRAAPTQARSITGRFKSSRPRIRQFPVSDD